MQVVDTVQDLLEELRGLVLGQRLLLGQKVEELAARDQLEDEHYIRLVLEDVVQRDDIGVPDLPQDAHLALDLLPAHPTPAGRQAPLLDELGRVLLACALLPALPHNGKLAAEGTERGRVSGWGHLGPGTSLYCGEAGLGGHLDE